MAKNQENQEMFHERRDTKMEFLGEHDYVVDIQGFQRISGPYIFKEVSFLGLRNTSLPSVHLFMPPISWNELSHEEQSLASWLEKNHHGTAWNAGDVPYHRIRRIFEICLQGARKVYTKGEQKKLWLQELLPTAEIFNVEDLNCPGFEKIRAEEKYDCLNHILCRWEPECAAKNVLTLRTWLQKYFAGELGRDEVDNVRSKNSISQTMYVS